MTAHEAAEAARREGRDAVRLRQPGRARAATPRQRRPVEPVRRRATIEALARRGRPRQSSRSGSFELQIDTHLTELDATRRPLPRPRRSDLATTHTFEQVADLLWTRRARSRTTRGAAPSSAAVRRRPAGGEPLRPAQVAVDLAAMADPLAGRLRPEAVAACGRSTSIATWSSSCRWPATDARRGSCCRRRRRADPGDDRRPALDAPVDACGPARSMLAVLNAALVLMADHELAASTFGVRVAASIRADPYAVVGAGLGRAERPATRRASRMARELLDDAMRRGRRGSAVTAELRSGQARTRLRPHACTSTAIRGGGAARPAPASRGSDTDDGHRRRRRGRGRRAAAADHPNVDFAARGARAGHRRMPDDAGEVVMSVGPHGRLAGPRDRGVRRASAALPPAGVVRR